VRVAGQIDHPRIVNPALGRGKGKAGAGRVSGQPPA
jgi:hypothetical protein